VKPKIALDYEGLNRTFREYAAISKRGIAENINQKAYSICLSAYGMTKRAKPSDIRSYLSGPSNASASAPVAAMIINKLRGQQGLPGLRGDEMKVEVNRFIKKKSAHGNYLRVGWFLAIQAYAGKIGKQTGAGLNKFANRVNGGGQHMQGGASPANPSNNPITRFWNTAFSKTTTTRQGVKIAEDGLAAAIQKQMRDMRVYIARKQNERTAQVFKKWLR
jgi:hypothetical protein